MRRGRRPSPLGLLLAVILTAAMGGPAGAAPPPVPGRQVLDPALAGILTTADGTTAGLSNRAPGLVTLQVHAPDGQVSLRLAASPGERFFGMGERFGSLDLRGRVLRNHAADGMGHPDVPVTDFDVAMQDYGEDAPVDGRYASGEPGALVHNAYPVLYARAAREAAQSAKPDATVLFARSGYTGSQAFHTGRFTGDQTRGWDRRTGLPAVLAGMLNGSVSGWPYWGPDIGGFFDGPGARDRELWTRWVQLGALSPVMRDMLGAQADPITAMTDATTLATFRGYARLHHALVPYLHGLGEQAHATGLPLMRPLWLAAPTDPTAWTVEDEYLLGADLLVAPVLRPGVTARPVYLPAGQWRE